MLKPPSEYERVETQLSSRSTKIDNLYFDSAIIFFIPKVADKGVNLASLSCTITQITDRGEWGKEEEDFTVEASSFSNRKYREFDLTTNAVYSMKINPPPELRMGILEIYFDPTIQNTSNMGTNNPATAPVDTEAIATAVGLAMQMNNEAQAQATAMAIRTSNTVKKPTGFTKQVEPWSGDITNHLIVEENPDRRQSKIYHTGKNGTANSNSQISLVVGDLNGKGVNAPDGYLNPQGDFTSNEDEDILAIYAWVAANKPAVTVSVSEFFL
jgi:hypothetical protein